MSNISVIFICGDNSRYSGYHFPTNFKVVPRVNDYVEVMPDCQSNYSYDDMPLELQVTKVKWSYIDGNQVASCYLYTPEKYRI